jgi:hypothetical protein
MPGLPTIARAVVAADAAAFALAASLNWGLRVQLGPGTLAFVPRVWQAGAGEAVIALCLGTAAVTGSRRLGWVAVALSGLGIAFGLASRAVQGLARETHVVLVALAVLVAVLLVVSGPMPRRAGDGR